MHTHNTQTWTDAWNWLWLIIKNMNLLHEVQKDWSWNVYSWIELRKRCIHDSSYKRKSKKKKMPRCLHNYKNPQMISMQVSVDPKYWDICLSNRKFALDNIRQKCSEKAISILKYSLSAWTECLLSNFHVYVSI